MNLPERKRVLRAQVKQLRAALDPHIKQIEQQHIDMHALRVLQNHSGAVAIYLAMTAECSCDAIMHYCWSNNIPVYAPKVQAEHNLSWHKILRVEDLKLGAFGILEPTTQSAVLPAELLMFVPGVAFTKAGRRLGMGGGFYDRFFEQLEHKPKTIGLAWSCQIVEDLPHEAHDACVDLVISPLFGKCSGEC